MFEQNHPELVAADGRGRAVQHTDFMAREKEEMRELTQASGIEKGVWVRFVSLSFFFSGFCFGGMELELDTENEIPHS